MDNKYNDCRDCFYCVKNWYKWKNKWKNIRCNIVKSEVDYKIKCDKFWDREIAIEYFNSDEYKEKVRQREKNIRKRKGKHIFFWEHFKSRYGLSKLH